MQKLFARSATTAVADNHNASQAPFLRRMDRVNVYFMVFAWMPQVPKRPPFATRLRLAVRQPRWLGALFPASTQGKLLARVES
eukprot:4288011-Pleurochrysis_carterae.AAC.2